MSIPPSVPTPPSGGEKWYLRFAKAAGKVPQAVFNVLKSVSKGTIQRFFGHTAKPIKEDRKIQKIEEEILHTFFVSKDRATSSLSNAIGTFREGNGSFHELQKAVLHAEQYYGSDPIFRPFLQTTEKLFKQFDYDDRALKKLVLPLLDQVLVKGEMSAKRGDEIGASLLFLSDREEIDALYEKPTSEERLFYALSLTSQKLVEGEKRWREKTLSRVCNEERIFKSSHKTIAADLIRTTLPRSIAADLVLSGGAINVGLISLIERSFLHSDTEVFDVSMPMPIPGDIQASITTVFKREKEAVYEAVDSICSDGWLQARFEALSSLEACPSGRKVINATLGRSLNDPVSSQDAQTACLSALLTNWRQGNIGSCHVTSVVQYVAAANNSYLLSDYVELISKGFLEREIQGTVCKFWGIERAVPKLSSKELKRSSRVIEALKNHKGFQKACSMLKVDVNEFTTRCGERFTIRSVFEQMRHDPRFSYSLEQLEEAMFQLESGRELALRRVHENAMASMTFPPVTVRSRQLGLITREVFGEVLRKTVLRMASKQRCLDVATRARLYRHRHLPGLSAEKSFLFKGFEKIRHCYGPAQDGSEKAVWTLALETEKGLQIAQNAEDAGNILTFALVELCRAAGATDDQIETIEKNVSREALLKDYNKRAQKPKGIRKALFSAPWKPVSIPSCKVGMTHVHVWDAYRGDSDYKGRYLKGAKAVLDFSKRVQEEYGTENPFVTVLASGDGHAFRLLPTDPSMVEWASNQEEFFSRWAEMVSQPISSYKTLQINLKNALKEMGQEVVQEGIFDNLKSKFGDPSNCPLPTYLEAFGEEVRLAMFATRVKEKGFFEKLVGRIKSLLPEAGRKIPKVTPQKTETKVSIGRGKEKKGLASRINRIRARSFEVDFEKIDGAIYQSLSDYAWEDLDDLLLKFADPNWARSSRIGYWFNPRGKVWQACVMYADAPPKHHFSLESGIEVSGEPLQEAKVKQACLVEQKTHDKLSHLETVFMDMWKVYKGKKDDVEKGYSSVGEAIGALKRCEEAKEEYLDTVKEIGQKALPKATELRFTAHLSSEIRELLFDPKSLQNEKKSLV